MHAYSPLAIPVPPAWDFLLKIPDISEMWESPDCWDDSKLTAQQKREHIVDTKPFRGDVREIVHDDLNLRVRIKLQSWDVNYFLTFTVENLTDGFTSGGVIGKCEDVREFGIPCAAVLTLDNGDYVQVGLAPSPQFAN